MNSRTLERPYWRLTSMLNGVLETVSAMKPSRPSAIAVEADVVDPGLELQAGLKHSEPFGGGMFCAMMAAFQVNKNIEDTTLEEWKSANGGEPGRSFPFPNSSSAPSRIPKQIWTLSLTALGLDSGRRMPAQRRITSHECVGTRANWLVCNSQAQLER